MKTLMLIRHAKSSWDDETLDDKARPLNERGLHDAPMMGQHLAERGVRADLILTSPAVRALSTAHIIADAIGYTRKDIIADERLYASSPGTLLAIIQGIDDAHQRVLIFGHNPEFTDLAHGLSRDIDEMPTCAVAEFDFKVKHWSEIGSAPPLSARLETPKSIKR